MKRIKDIHGIPVKIFQGNDRDTSFDTTLEFFGAQGRVGFYWWTKADALKDLESLRGMIDKLIEEVEE